MPELVSATDPNQPGFRGKAYEAQRPLWTLVDDVLTGTVAIRAKGEVYTPKARGESDERFQARLKRSRFYNVYARVLTGLVARVFRRPPKLASKSNGESKSLIIQHVENIDGQGTHFAVFLRRLFRYSVHHGCAAILIDAPPDPDLGRAPTVAEVKRLGLRPYWVLLRADQILNFRVTVANGAPVLSSITVRELSIEPEGVFGETEVVRYLVFRLVDGVVEWERWEEREGKVSKDSNGVLPGTSVIPVVPCYGGEPTGWFQCQPMLHDLAETNLDHYAVQSDHRYSLHVASIPIPVIKSSAAIDQVIPISVEDGIRLDVAGDAYFLEHTGSALGQTREEQRDLEQRMQVLGLQTMVGRRTSQAETAEAKRIDGAETESILAVAARSTQDAAEQALLIHAQMIGEEAPEVTVNFDFDGLTLAPAQLNAIREVWEAGGITRDTFWAILEQGGMLPEEFDRRREAQTLDQEALQRPVITTDPEADPEDPASQRAAAA